MPLHSDANLIAQSLGRINVTAQPYQDETRRACPRNYALNGLNHFQH
jgi:hypothetical protein